MGADDSAAPGRTLSQTPADPYRALVGLAERERELVAEGRMEELLELDARRRAIIRTLPPAPPREAALLLRRCAELQAETSAALEGAMRAAELELQRLGTGRAAVRGYSPGAGVEPVVDWAG